MTQQPAQTSLVRPLAVIAFGGNALIQARDLGTVEEQIRRADEAAVWLVDVCRQGYDLLVVHGNGPQVGRILIQMQEGAAMVPPATMDFAVAETQGSVGYLLGLAILNRLRAEGVEREVATVVSLVVVDRDDTGFQEPTKPVGPFFSEYQAQQMTAEGGWKMMEDAGRGWRKVVASPQPLEVLGVVTVRVLLASNHVVMAGGGGGIPVVRDDDGGLRGVEAVIDKDRTAALLALELDAELLVIVTEVSEVYRNFGQKNQRALRRIAAPQVRKLLAAGEFPAGSMGPKIEAAVEFLTNGGRTVVITTPGRLAAAMDGKAGTRIVP